MRLTNRDFRLLLELDRNCKTSFSGLSRKVKLSPQLISYKIKAYQDEGVISSFTSFMDYAFFGLLHFRVYFKVNYLSKEKFKNLLNFLYDYPGVVGLEECGGTYDLIAIFAALNPSEFNKRLKNLIAHHPVQLKNYVILTTIIGYYYPREYFLEGKDVQSVQLFRDPSGSQVIIGGDRAFLNLSKKDKMLLSLLQNSARVSSVQLSRKVHLDPKTIRSRIRLLQERAIIKAFRPVINVQQIGFLVNKILLKYHNFSVEKEQELLTFCKFNPFLVEYIKVLGEWDLELTVETKTREEFQQVCFSIREKFEDIIADFVSFPLFNTHKKEFIPNHYFTQKKDE